MLYLAQPYTHRDVQTQRERYHCALQANTYYVLQKQICFSPIIHYHDTAFKFNLPTDFAFWKEVCKKHQRLCNKFIIYQLEGWEDSVGLKAERAWAERWGMDIDYLSHETVLTYIKKYNLENPRVKA